MIPRRKMVAKELCLSLGLNWVSLVAQTVKSLPAMWESWIQSLGWEDPLEKEMSNPLQYSCLENPMDGGVWQATCHGVTKSQTKLSDFTFTFTLHCPGLCRFRTPICTDGPQNSEHFPCPSHLSSGWLKGMALRGTDFGRNDAKAETPVLWPPHAKS